jgi:hypothetical protein
MTRPVRPHESVRADHAAVADMLRRERLRAWDDDHNPGAGLGFVMALAVLGFAVAGVIGLLTLPHAAAGLRDVVEAAR